jgi:hypothetical protein
MSLKLPSGIIFRKNDSVRVTFGGTGFDGVVAYAGEGFMSPFEDMFYLLAAPHHGLADLFSEDNEIRGAFVLVAIHSSAVPCSRLPAQAVLQSSSKNNDLSVVARALAIVGGPEGKDEYLIYLDVSAKK